jgi:hypothetical protein
MPRFRRTLRRKSPFRRGLRRFAGFRRTVRQNSPFAAPCGGPLPCKDRLGALALAVPDNLIVAAVGAVLLVAFAIVLRRNSARDEAE